MPRNVRTKCIRLLLAVTLSATLAACSLASRGGTGQATPSPSSAAGGVRICEQYDASPMPSGYDSDGCWAPAEYFERAPEVNPEVSVGAPTLRIEASGTAPMGSEGTLLFVRAVSPTGRIILEREWEWPRMEQEMPPGAYQVTAYARHCDANCGYLDPTMLSCTIDVLAEPSMTYTMTYDVEDGTTVTCHLDR